MKYVVKAKTEDGGYLEASRLLAELRAARRELKAERRKVHSCAA